MKIAITITICVQRGIDTYKDIHQTGIFNENSTVKEIDEWIKSVDKNASLTDAIISDINHDPNQ